MRKWEAWLIYIDMRSPIIIFPYYVFTMKGIPEEVLYCYFCKESCKEDKIYFIKGFSHHKCYDEYWETRKRI